MVQKVSPFVVDTHFLRVPVLDASIPAKEDPVVTRNQVDFVNVAILASFAVAEAQQAQG